MEILENATQEWGRDFRPLNFYMAMKIHTKNRNIINGIYRRHISRQFFPAHARKTSYFLS